MKKLSLMTLVAALTMAASVSATAEVYTLNTFVNTPLVQWRFKNFKFCKGKLPTIKMVGDEPKFGKVEFVQEPYVIEDGKCKGKTVPSLRMKYTPNKDVTSKEGDKFGFNVVYPYPEFVKGDTFYDVTVRIHPEGKAPVQSSMR